MQDGAALKPSKEERTAVRELILTKIRSNGDLGLSLFVLYMFVFLSYLPQELCAGSISGLF
jgi:hypothetical protein